MKVTLGELLDSIVRRRAALLNDYSEYDLHQLRVSVRRLRSLLRFEDLPTAWQLRREWGFLISHTNPARDWDTLAERLDALPEDQQPVALMQAVEERRDKVWKDALRSLRNAQWEDSAQRMREYIDQTLDSERKPPDPTVLIEEARTRVNQAWERAQAEGDTRSWHKLRTAFKDLRYNLEALPPGSVDEPVALCERMQDLLGVWHDSLMHRELLQDIARSIPADERSAREAIANLDTELFAQSMRCLKEARHVMAARAQLVERRQPDGS
ncbi:MAG: CHAD domain-containing protein [Halieaceae bacterium]|nr:CHAD domain-containing protein [Halieaceae bacterium]